MIMIMINRGIAVYRGKQTSFTAKKRHHATM